MSKRDLVRFGAGNKYDKMEEPVGDAESILSPAEGETSPIQRHPARTPSYTENTPGEMWGVLTGYQVCCLVTKLANWPAGSELQNIKNP